MSASVTLLLKPGDNCFVPGGSLTSDLGVCGCSCMTEHLPWSTGCTTSAVMLSVIPKFTDMDVFNRVTNAFGVNNKICRTVEELNFIFKTFKYLPHPLTG